MMFVICSLAIWRISLLLHEEDGPFNLFSKLRKALRGSTIVLDCFLCLSIWISLPFSLLFHRWYVYWFALSGASCVIYKLMELVDEY